MSSIGGQRSPIILAASNTAVPLTGTTNETALATITIPANLMGANGSLRIYTLWSYTNSANNKVLRARFGGIGGTAYLGQIFTTTAACSDMRIIANNNATNAQKGWNINGSLLGSSSGALATGAVDTTASTTLVISGTLANSGETITLEAYIVEFIPGV